MVKDVMRYSFNVISQAFLCYLCVCSISQAIAMSVIVDSSDLPFNPNYEIRIYNSKRNCNDTKSKAKLYQVYTENALKKLVADELSTSLWAKVVQDNIDISFCVKGDYVDNKVIFKLKPNNFGLKRIIMVISNSSDLSKTMGGSVIWDFLIRLMIESFNSHVPLTLVTLNEDRTLDFVVQAEDLVHMYYSFRTDNPYPQLTKLIRSKVTMDQHITEPMKSLYVVHDMFMGKINRIIFFTDQKNIPSLDELKTNPNHAKMPLYWDNYNIPFEVLTNGKCEVWHKAKAKCFLINDLNSNMLNEILGVTTLP